MIFALGSSTIVSSVEVKGEKVKNGSIDMTFTIRYNLSDKFGDVFGTKGKVEYGKPYDMIGPTKIETIKMNFDSKKDYEEYLKEISKR